MKSLVKKKQFENWKLSFAGWKCENFWQEVLSIDERNTRRSWGGFYCTSKGDTHKAHFHKTQFLSMSFSLPQFSVKLPDIMITLKKWTILAILNFPPIYVVFVISMDFVSATNFRTVMWSYLFSSSPLKTSITKFECPLFWKDSTSRRFRNFFGLWNQKRVKATLLWYLFSRDIWAVCVWPEVSLAINYCSLLRRTSLPWGYQTIFFLKSLDLFSIEIFQPLRKFYTDLSSFFSAFETTSPSKL